MSRLSQLYWFLNEEKMPTELEIKHTYTKLSITPEIKQLRKEHRLAIKKEKRRRQLALWKK